MHERRGGGGNDFRKKRNHKKREKQTYRESNRVKERESVREKERKSNCKMLILNRKNLFIFSVLFSKCSLLNITVSCLDKITESYTNTSIYHTQNLQTM